MPGFIRFTDVVSLEFSQTRTQGMQLDSICITGSGVGGGRAEDDRRFFSLPTTTRGNRRDQPIDLLFRLGKPCARQIRPSFPTCTSGHSRGNPLHVKSGRPFRHARPMQWCEVGVHTVPDIRSRLFLWSDVPGILAMHLRSRKDNAKPEKCYETCRATTR